MVALGLNQGSLTPDLGLFLNTCGHCCPQLSFRGSLTNVQHAYFTGLRQTKQADLTEICLKCPKTCWNREKPSSKISKIHTKWEIKKNGLEASQYFHGLSVFREYLPYLINRPLNENDITKNSELTVKCRSLGSERALQQIWILSPVLVLWPWAT